MSVLVQFRGPQDKTTYSYGPYAAAEVYLDTLWVRTKQGAEWGLATFDPDSGTWQILGLVERPLLNRVTVISL